MGKDEALSFKDRLEEIYRLYNRREYVHPDPLEFLYDYADIRDREIVALIASSLAYGRVVQILRSVAFVLGKMNPSPRAFLHDISPEGLRRIFSGFRHRFTTGAEIAGLLWRTRGLIERYGSLQECFLAGFRPGDDTVLSALSAFSERLESGSRGCRKGFIPAPGRGSACKRLHLFLRWMIRQDEVDPGGWRGVPPSKLIVPLDVHMHRISLRAGWTRRRQADMRAALEVTRAFRRIAPEDPARYDFVLTRFGIRSDMDPGGWRPLS